MTGWALLKHSFGMVERNFGTAVRISVVLMILMMVISFLLSSWVVANAQVLVSSGAAGAVAFQLVIGLISMVITAWIAVAWHRYVLMNEAPRGWIPTFHGSNIINYVIWAFVLTVIYLLFLVPVGVIAFGWLLPQTSQPGGTPDVSPGLIALIAIAFLICFSASIVILMRLSPVLVSRALGQRLGLSDAWKATQGSSKAIIGLFFWSFLIAFAVMFCLSFIMALLGGVAALILLPLVLIAQWFLSIVSISVVTTIYGHYVEGRELSLQ